jgi:hypothetical protein
MQHRCRSCRSATSDSRRQLSSIAVARGRCYTSPATIQTDPLSSAEMMGGRGRREDAAPLAATFLGAARAFDRDSQRSLLTAGHSRPRGAIRCSPDPL